MEMPHKIEITEWVNKQLVYVETTYKDLNRINNRIEKKLMSLEEYDKHISICKNLWNIR